MPKSLKLGVESWLRLAIHVRENGQETLLASHSTQQHAESTFDFQDPNPA
tara:strand:- start:491 stop:640 length:150 start_codon:yes stop_codon:yes gene_type:complete